MADGLVPMIKSELADFMYAHRVRNGVYARIEGAQGLIGALGVYTIGVRPFTPAELGFLQISANIIGTALTIEHNTAERERSAALQASRLKSAFLANTTHEIRSPLNVILGYSELVAENLSEAADLSQVSYLDAIRRAGRRLLSTIDKIVDYSRLEAGQLKPQPETIDLAAVAEALVDEHRALASRQGLKLSYMVETSNTIISFDRHCLEHAIANPLNNAVKFTESGSVSVRLYRSGDGMLHLEIRDSGIGIASSYLTRLFEPFSQEDCGIARRYEGTGLGLALTRRYAELNGASVAVQSKKGEGTTVTLHFAGTPSPIPPA